MEADKRRKKRLAALARDHIIKLREERQNLAQGWLNEYSERAVSARLQGKSLGVLRAEYINRYNRLLDRERQPHSDFFVNLTPDVEEELDFAEEEPFRLNEYVSHYAWDEAEYLKLRFIAARHYASRGHWDNAYAYILRTRPDGTSQHEDTYNRNAQAWHYTNARINELIQEAEQALEAGNGQLAQGPTFKPPVDSLIPPGHPTETTPGRGVSRTDRVPDQPLNTGTIKEPERQERRASPRSPLSPDYKSQKAERDSAIDAVKQITGVQKGTPSKEGPSVTGTPEYDWDPRYDGIQGFPSCLQNRVSEPSTPQRGQSPRGEPKTPPEPQRYHKQLKVYDETPTGRPLPTLQQIRQANLRKIFEEEGADTPCDICGDLRHDYRNCTKEAYLESQDVRQDFRKREDTGKGCPHCDVRTRGFVLVLGVTNLATSRRIVWLILLIAACKLDFPRERHGENPLLNIMSVVDVGNPILLISIVPP